MEKLKEKMDILLKNNFKEFERCRRICEKEEMMFPNMKNHADINSLFQSCNIRCVKEYIDYKKNG